MTVIKGQIESLKRLRSELYKRGIFRFNSIREIKDFLQKYETEKKLITQGIEQDLDEEIIILKSDRRRLEQEYIIKVSDETKLLNSKIENIEYDIVHLESLNSNFLLNAIKFLKLKRLKSKKAKFEKYFDDIIEAKTFLSEQNLINTNRKLLNYIENRSQVIADRCKSKFNKLFETKEVIDEMYPLIAGAIGEKKVVNELKKLPDNYILINDFSVEFDPPIYNRKEDDRIFSIQVDHLLISQSGIFLIETKNWNQKSIERYDLRSPISQIKRTSFALFVILNSNLNYSGVNLEWHHWGEKKIPIRNVIAMANRKPIERFKHVAIKSINELNRYLTYFDPIFSDNEVKSIEEYLEQKGNN